MKIIWAQPARLDLLDIFDYIASASPKSAKTLLIEIKNRTALLIDNPHMGRIGRVYGTRELVVTGTPFILPYRISGQHIQILAVFHGARQWPENFNS